MSERRVSGEGLVPRSPDSELAVDALRLGAGDAGHVGADGDDTLLFVFEGQGTVSTGGGRAVAVGTAVLVPAGESAMLTAGTEGLAVLRASIGPEVDRHAPLGPPATVVATDRVESGSATGKRSFQVLFGAHNGSTCATLFVGYVPPGAAPWHFHLYDEIVWIWRGEGRFHTDAGVESLGPGCAFRIRPREVHIVENTSATDELVVLGLFTPAGSPSAAYLTADVQAAYGIEAAP
jgi:quercetin dioxygenase-like cupin family protein